MKVCFCVHSQYNNHVHWYASTMSKFKRKACTHDDDVIYAQREMKQFFTSKSRSAKVKQKIIVTLTVTSQRTHGEMPEQP